MFGGFSVESEFKRTVLGSYPSGICGLVEPRTLGWPPLLRLVWRSSTLGRWLTHGDLALEAKVDFLAGAE